VKVSDGFVFEAEHLLVKDKVKVCIIFVKNIGYYIFNAANSFLLEGMQTGPIAA